MNVGLSFGAHGFGHGGATQIVAYAVDLRFDPQQMTLCERLSQLPQADPGIRAQIDEAAMRHGWPVLHAQLAAAGFVDGPSWEEPTSAESAAELARISALVNLQYVEQEP